VDTVIKYLENLGDQGFKKLDVRDGMLMYLRKHKQEIPNYEARRRAGKTIGSGRMEQSVNQIVGARQKDKGMGWSEQGSRALAVLTLTAENGQWHLVETCLAA
jgi:hypothetical protein